MQLALQANWSTNPTIERQPATSENGYDEHQHEQPTSLFLGQLFRSAASHLAYLSLSHDGKPNSGVDSTGTGQRNEVLCGGGEQCEVEAKVAAQLFGPLRDATPHGHQSHLRLLAFRGDILVHIGGHPECANRLHSVEHGVWQ